MKIVVLEKIKRYKYFQSILDFYNLNEQHEVFALGAQLTFYWILAIFPFLIFLITALSYTPISEDKSLANLSMFFPSSATTILLKTVHEIINSRSINLLSFSIIGTIWAASNGLNAMIKALNKAYGQKDDRPFWQIRLISILFTLALALVFTISLVMLIFGKVIAENIFNFLGVSILFKGIWNILQYVVPLLIMFGVFCILYAYSTREVIPFKKVLPGALFSTFGWILISKFFSYYINNFGDYSKMYGSLGGVIILLIWIYWSNLLILVGGELNASLSVRSNTNPRN